MNVKPLDTTAVIDRTGPLFKTACELKGRYKLIRIKAATGEEVEETPWSDNLITDYGKDQFLSATSASIPTWFHCAVGSGSTTPSPSDTLLVSPIAGVSQQAGWQAQSNNSDFTGGVGKLVYTHRLRFGEGVAQGNVAEVGIVSNGTTNPSSSAIVSSPLFSRALIRNASGAPTVVTVAADEFLDVVWELTISLSSRVEGECPWSIKGTPSLEDYVIKPAATNYLQPEHGWGISDSSGAASSNASVRFPFPVFNTTNLPRYTSGYYSSTEPVITGYTPTGGTTTSTTEKATASTRSTYVSGSFKRTFTWTFGLNQLNTANPNAFRLNFNIGQIWLYFPSATIPKTNTDTLNVSVEFSIV